MEFHKSIPLPKLILKGTTDEMLTRLAIDKAIIKVINEELKLPKNI